MAVGKICDRCGLGFKFKKDINEVNGISFTHFDALGNATNSVSHMELCPSCLAIVQEAAQPIVEEEEE